ncbi:helicase-exonuclease AddAB, AddA subunit [Enterococcus sp. DIV2402]|uniref:ATP-dependent helicase/nuclease subunit A n=1 Tax=Candidatus Enterococcus lowellii TaxID=2230877 RepID=A0ABZ2SP85_9ENTE|nr:helicase-exonuclease AddAB subunit AddA [Enterococcus sp. DIV2402]MBO0463648.1 helicase-exonuclease AddAB subunit AddA [Enterococcus sp. DIV2402]
MIKIPLKPSNETFTDTQWQSIFDKGDNLLISASAGSGKTTVLVRRVIEKLKSGSNIDELLIVTFTEAAAREMKERIQVALQDAVNKESDSEKRKHFVRQLTLLPMANISTLHAFCLTVIRRFYFLIDLDPVFRMLTDETESILLKEEVWEELRDACYEAKDESFYRLTENFSSDRSDEGVTDLVMSLYTFARANPNPTKWLTNLADNYQTEDGLTQNQLYKSQLKPAIIHTLEAAIQRLEIGLQLAQIDALIEKAATLVADELAQAQRLLSYFQEDTLDLAYAQIEGLSFGRYPAFRKEEQKELSEPVKIQRQTAKELVESVKQFFAYAPEEMLALMEQARPIVEEMGNLTQRFMENFQQRKLDKGVLDFNDLEHFTLAILRGEGQGSEASAYYRQKFEEVLVDEYQDVNRLQEAILYWVREPDDTQGNMFMVGDVKQSIYAFRLADPTLFIDKYLAFEKAEGGRRIVLAENFRSRSEVLQFTNLVFQQLMDEEVGQIPYDDAAKLIPGFPAFPESNQFQTELLLFEKGVEEDADVVDDKTEGELHLVALKVKELIQQQFEIYDKKMKAKRPVSYKDIVLLTPTRKNNLVIMDIFKKFDIPLEVNDAQNYFQATEVQTMIALLQIIDNPYQDIPLVAVLRSPIVGLNEEELAEIRLMKKNGDYLEAVQLYAVKDTELAQQVQKFLAQLDVWREMARRRSLSELIWSIYEETAYLDYVIGLPSGRQRYANLVALANRAESYEQSSFRGLYQFIRFIEKMQEKDKDLAEPLAISTEDAVRVMTVHASKGLEFPIVFLLDTTKQFNYQDFNSRYIFEERLGAGIQFINEERIRFDTLPYQAIKQVRIQKALSEEMRKLYVAFTRAEQKLYLVGSYKTKEDAFKNWSRALTQENLVLDSSLRLSGKGNLMNWIGLTLMRHPDMQKVYDNIDAVRTVRHDANFQIHWWNQAELLEQLPKVLAEPIKPEQLAIQASEETAEFQRRLAFTYPLEKSTMTTSYQSVSEMKRIYNDPDEQDIAKLDWESTFEQSRKQHFRYASDELAKPKFLQKEKIEPTAIGSATHTLLQLLPLTAIPTKESIQDKLTELVTNNYLEKAVAEKIDIDAIVWFYQTDLGKSLVQHANNVHREQPFSMLKDAQTVFLDFEEPGAELLVHGIIDGYIELDDYIILYDFKTDAVYANNEEKIQQQYQGQLRLYKEALQQSLKKPVTETYLVLLNGQTILPMKNL